MDSEWTFFASDPHTFDFKNFFDPQKNLYFGLVWSKKSIIYDPFQIFDNSQKGLDPKFENHWINIIICCRAAHAKAKSEPYLFRPNWHTEKRELRTLFLPTHPWSWRSRFWPIKIVSLDFSKDSRPEHLRVNNEDKNLSSFSSIDSK